ncbi:MULTISPECIES: ligase-associated DNA damage response DEXH box helicase [Halocynthiibacter]|uniref:Ligase-associated DNA damage response DEXH box helicase n=1 Tax=Halocynthiibacter halioticoli TaxID=2986804 RepID=A0AAE3LR79_9RHOB|nr:MULTISPECIES: ligase-associated DNA damage response DEXH box helicase [Halocynthiibacter]MCV6825282.1 ligase-associated DNA damage response DEXH box helicase [Halocynthiibacter halioticoli]MCW4058283.1 ligase-associated DNA damage response DEXH box helicase [Halocynthiibacter sp. SDUM655004]
MTALPQHFENWFDARGWQAHPHQLEMLAKKDEPAQLLIAPTGGGKTLAGFLPTLVELGSRPQSGLHTLYISPLKALAADIRRNLEKPVTEIGLDIRIEDRTGDTPATRKKRQRVDPPHILLTTPESLALLLSYEDAPRMFAGVSRVIVDEIHALAESKRGDQLMLALSRLQALAPNLRRVGLSATVEEPEAIAKTLAFGSQPCSILHAPSGPTPDIQMLKTTEAPPWSGGGAAYSIPAVMELVKQHKTTLIFHNTRAQAEIFFHNLWLANDDALPIGIHHGSLARAAREKTEAAMAEGKLRAIVCTGSLDLGIDWGDVDLVIQIGAPKNVKRLVQRIGRANHVYNAPSKAILVPANRFEVVECVAALEAVREMDLDGEPHGRGPLDVLCQHILIRAASGPFHADALFDEFRSTGDYASLTRAEFDGCLDFIATGGYALRTYDRWQRLLLKEDGMWHLRDPRSTQRIRMNLGTIQDTDKLKVRMRGRGSAAPLGEIEESFAATLEPGDTFLIGGEIVRFVGLREMDVIVRKDAAKRPRIATFMGTKFATSTQLSHRILDYFQRSDWSELPNHTADWLMLQKTISALPNKDELLIETFPNDGLEHLCIYGFAGRNALQTLGLLLTHRLETLGFHPLGFVATDYALMIWGLDEVTDFAPLFEPANLRDGLENWLAESAVMKRSFKTCATIAGLIDRNGPHPKKSGRQTTFSSDILYNTLLKYDPDHLMLRITKEEAMRGLVDFSRIEEMLTRTNGKLLTKRLERVSPLAAPLLLEIGNVPVRGSAQERLLTEEAERMLSEVGLE